MGQRRTGREHAVRRVAPTRGHGRQPLGGQEGPGHPVQVRIRQRRVALHDVPAAGGQHPAGEPGLLTQLAGELGQVAAVGEGAQQPPLPAERGPQLLLADDRDGADDLLGDLGEGHLRGHPDQRQVVPATGLDQVGRHRVALTGRADGERAGPGGGDVDDEPLAVIGVAAPQHPADDQLAAGQVAARVEQVGGADPAQRPVDLFVGAVQELEPQRRNLQQIAQSHGGPPIFRPLAKPTTDRRNRRLRWYGLPLGPGPARAVDWAP